MSEDTTIDPQSPAPRRPIDRLSDAAIGVAASALFGLVVVQGWQVIARYVLNDSPSWTEPVTLLLLSTAMSLGAASGVHTQRHFGFFLLADAAPPRLRRVLSALTPLVIIAIGAVIAFWASRLLADGIDIRVAGAAMPQSINYLPLAIGGVLMVVFAINQLWKALSAGAVEGDR
ncbi:TRAP transporter small permease [Pseudoxanthomonas dokdonensis]|uniref:TRAP transporter small permease protein n=1 Tax=Pseudoxanthomonas dokdonensis TaxID=344882 RepID=A0A0R0CQ81_9GAMM|nr:TRAP transporter small permease [Pseudoxanthomonas dokdonensis]KRG68578.1 C4-dicarboxylate ABC transporter [Pseudoxanthomonas dokdonensis]